MQLKEPQDQRGLKKLILRNNDKYRKRSIDLLLLMESTRLDMSHIQSYINSVCKIMILVTRRSIQKGKRTLR